MKHKDENAKNKDWKTPMKMPGVRKEQYELTPNANDGQAAPGKPRGK